MRKIFLLTFDDGVVWDQGLVEMLNYHQIPATFNLNSGLEDFVWEYGTHPVQRLRLAEHVNLYNGHEIASHSLHHPPLDTLSHSQLCWEVGEDVRRLKLLFGKQKLGFAVPFTVCREREIGIIRPLVSYIRLSEMTDSFALPADPYHIPIHGLYNDLDIRDKIRSFAESDLPVSLFVMAGHSYELEFLRQWDHMDMLLRYIKEFGFEFMTTMDFVEEFYPEWSR